MDWTLQTKSTYGLAKKWLALTRAQGRWDASRQVAAAAFRPAGYLIGKVVDWKSWRREAIEGELFPRFASTIECVLTSAKCPKSELDAEGLRCMLRVVVKVNADPKARCLPELIWLSAAEYGHVPEHLQSKLRLRFHLLALVDELPSSDERGALRDVVYGSDPERETNVDAGDSPRRRGEIERGLEAFSRFLYDERDRVQNLTDGAITVAMLPSLESAQDLVMQNLGVPRK